MNIQTVEMYLMTIRRELRLPGLAIAIVQDGEVIYSRGFGSAAPGRAVDAQTPFILGSLSKSFTALAVMQLVESGKLRLDDPVQVALPWFTVVNAAAAPVITIRHLLTHTSGLSRYAGRDLLSGRGDKSVEQSVRALSAQRLVHVPGTRFEYSNSNYLVLACVIETVSGLSYPSYVERFIFKPLSMRESAAAPVVPGLSQGHRWWFGWPVPFDAPYLFDAQAAAFLSSSASDMARWLSLHLSDGSLDGVRLLSPAGMEALHTSSVPTQKRGSSAAMGWRVESLAGEQILRHGGEVSNFRADMLLVPGRGLGVVTLHNANNGLVAQLGLDQVAANVMRLLLGLPLPEKRVTFSRFYLGLNLGLAVLSVLQVFLWPVLALSGGPTVVLSLVLALDLLWPFLALFRLPRAVDMPWRGLRLYVPDVSCWLIGVGAVTVVLNVLILLKWFL